MTGQPTVHEVDFFPEADRQLAEMGSRSFAAYECDAMLIDCYLPDDYRVIGVVDGDAVITDTDHSRWFRVSDFSTLNDWCLNEARENDLTLDLTEAGLRKGADAAMDTIAGSEL